MMIPTHFPQAFFCLKNIAPIIIVNNGVVEFKIPARELAMTVSARQKR